MRGMSFLKKNKLRMRYEKDYSESSGGIEEFKSE
jgi:hypothetical protein